MKLPKPVQVVTCPEPHLIYGANVGHYPIHHFTIFHPQIPLPLYVSSCGDDDNVCGVWRQHCNPDHYSLELIIEGEFAISVNDQNFRCQAGDLFLIHLARPMRMECLSEYSLKRTVALSGTLVKQIYLSLGLDNCNMIHLHNFDTVNTLFQDIDKLMQLRNPHNLPVISGKLYTLLSEISTQIEEAKLSPQFLKILDYLQKHIDTKLSMKQLSSALHISERTIFALFHDNMQTSPIRYIQKLRMERAKILLKEARLPIKEIAALCGYDNQLYFSTEFHRLEGCSPRAYSKANALDKCVQTDKNQDKPE